MNNKEKQCNPLWKICSIFFNPWQLLHQEAFLCDFFFYYGFEKQQGILNYLACNHLHR